MNCHERRRESNTIHHSEPKQVLMSCSEFECVREKSYQSGSDFEGRKTRSHHPESLDFADSLAICKDKGLSVRLEAPK